MSSNITYSKSIILLTVLGGAVFLAVPHFAGAATKLDKTTPDLAPPTTVTISPDLRKAWQGLYSLPAYSLVRKQPPVLKTLVGQYLGRTKTATTITYRTYYYNPEAVYRWLSTTFVQTIDVAAQEPRLTIEDGRAIEFQPPQVGRKLNVYQTTLNVIQVLEKGGDTASLAVDNASPRTELADLNNLGIKELVSRGQSSFKGSPNNRRHNIAVGIGANMHFF